MHIPDSYIPYYLAFDCAFGSGDDLRSDYANDPPDHTCLKLVSHEVPTRIWIKFDPALFDC
jgi:hypothetical protein